MKKVVTIITIAIITIVLALLNNNKIETIEQAKAVGENSEVADFSSKVNTHKIKNLMIVAHPDDETIWGGDHLLEEDYLVVCVTCGNVKVRDKEIRTVLNISEDELIKLKYPDLTKKGVSTWEGYKEDISADLTEIINMKNYDKIVTHNPDGEYGHSHHKMLNKIVTNIVKRENLTEKLYYFAKYDHNKSINTIDNKTYRVKNYNKKMQMVNSYKSQDYIIKDHGHAMISEKWQKYTDLKEELELKNIKA